MNTTPQPPTFRFARVVFATIAVLFSVLWATAYLGAEPQDPLQRDWRCLWEAGRGFNEGRLDALYADHFKPGEHSGICQSGYFWLYPPYALYPVSLLGSLPKSLAYPAVLLGVYGCYVLFILTIRRFYSQETSTVMVFALGVLASAPMCSVVVTGQNSAWILLGITLGIASLGQKRWTTAGIFFAILGLKPNWLPLVLVWLGFRRHWWVLATISLTGFLMVLSSLPLGIELWRDFQISSVGYGSYVLNHYPVDKLITVHAALRMVPGIEGLFLTLLWLVGVAVGLWACWATWTAKRSLIAQGSVVVLVTVACNIYTNFYDALLLSLPAAVWWFEREQYSARIWNFIGAVIGTGWLWMWIHFFGSRGETPGHLGLLLLSWMILEGLQSARVARAGNA